MNRGFHLHNSSIGNSFKRKQKKHYPFNEVKDTMNKQIIFSHNRNTFIFVVSVFLLVISSINFSFANDNRQRAKVKQKTEISAISKSSNSSSKPEMQKANNKAFVEGVVVVKFRQHVNLLNKSVRTNISAIDNKLNKHGVYAIERALPFLAHSTKKTANNLRNIYYFNYSSGENPKEVALDFAINPNVEYAEPQYLYKLNATPNDLLYASMQQFSVVDAPEAWDIIKGEAGNVVIAVVDGGTDWQHEDLLANIWNNSDEIADNGIDDDNNGFVDDIRGWNFTNNSNNPKGLSRTPFNAEHGTHTAGTACAVTNNNIGVASMSWNCTLMPINISSPQDSTLSFAAQGIAYAADNGADIISLSFGGPGPLSLFENEVINFAHENGSLVIAAAGNGNENNDITPHFPSNYKHVLAVGATDNSDRKANFSNYGVTVDVFAPGVGINSTQPNNQYSGNFWQGTSMSAPFVAGIAGLVKTLHPDWSPDQIREQLRVTADNVDSQNSPYAGRMGKGRVNALQALTLTELPAIRYAGSSFTDSGGDGIIDANETVDLQVLFTNFLENAANVSLTLTSDDPNVTITNATGNLSALNTNDTLAVNFQFQILNAVEDGTILSFYTDISAGNYSDRDFFTILINPARFADHDTGTLQTSITTQGNLGFVGFAEESPGVGFVFDGSNYLFEGGLMIGTGTSMVSDCIRGTVGSTQDDDFRPASNLSITSPGEIADEEGMIVLDDAFAANPLGLEISQESFAYTSEPFNDFVIFKYTIQNNGSVSLTNLYAGLFFDWDISESGGNDGARFDQVRNMGYAQNQANNPTKLAGTKVLTSPGATSYRAIHNPNDIYGGDAGNGFTDIEKWNFLSRGIQTRSIDTTDVSTLTSTGPFTLSPNQSVEIAFAVIAGSSSDDLFSNADASQYLWDNDLIPEIDLSPPSISTSVLQNPAASKYADIVVLSEKALKEVPKVKIWVGSDTTSVNMSTISNTLTGYKGAFEFNEIGTYTIQTKAVDLINGVDSTQTRSFAVALAGPDFSTILSSLNNKAILYIDEHSVREETYFIADYQEVEDEIIYQFGPQKELSKPLNLELDYNESAFPDVSKLFIYHKEGEEWKPLRSQVFTARHRIKTQIFELGEFKLVYDSSFDGNNLVPETYSLMHNYPNPFNPATTIEYDLPEDGLVVITVFNSLGQIVRTLYDGRQLAGSYKVHWDATNEKGHQISSGVYFYRLKAGKFINIKKMILLR